MKKMFVTGWMLVILLLILGTTELRNLKTHYSVDQFYPKNHTLLTHHEEIQKKFRLNEDSPYLFVIQIEKDGFLKKTNINSLKLLSDAIAGRGDVKQVLSMTHIEGASFKDEEMVIGNLFDRRPASVWREEIKKNSLLYPLLVSEDFSSVILAVESKLKDKRSLQKFEDSLEEKIQDYFPSAKITTAGIPVLQTSLSDMIQSELVVFLFYTSLAFCIVFYFLFSHWTAIACALVTLIFTNVAGLALMSWAGIPMNAILVTLPVIISVSVMSLLIHTLHLWSQKRQENLPFEDQVQRAFDTLKEIWLPNALGILTTALGFLALAPSPIPLIAQYGWIVAAILTFIALIAQLEMFLFLPFVQPRMRSWFDKPATWALWSINNPRKTVTLLGVLSFGGFIMLSQLNFSLRLFDDLPVGNPARASTEWIDRAFGGVLSYEIKADSNAPGFWKEPTNLKRLESLAENLRTHQGIGTVVSVSDFFQDGIDDKKEVIAETFFLFSMAEKDPLRSFMSDDARSLRLSIRLSDKPSDELERTRLWIRKTYQQHFPEIKFSEGGMVSYAHAINQEVAKALIFDFWQPLALIGLFLVFMFGSLRWAILSCLPNFIPPAVLIGALGFTQVAVKPGVALIFSIALGFAFNNTLYLLTRMRRLLKDGEEDALKKALLQEGNPCFFESLVMFTGFAIFLQSDFTMNQTFGGFMLLSIVAGFAADLFFLPAFMKLFPKSYALTRLDLKKVTVTTLVLISYSAQAAPDAKEILKKSQALLDAKDDQAMVEMKIIEQNGESKSRQLALKTLRESGFSVLARIQSPADIKDMAFLGNVDEEGNEKQWIYMPSSGQVRRLVTGKTKAGLLGSEISPEDLNSEAVKSSSAKLAKTDDKFYWIEITPAEGTSEYTKVVSKISKDDYLPKFTAYYIADKLKKTVSFKDYKKFGNVFRAQFMNVQNHLNGRQTEVRLSQIKVNTGLSSDDFTQSSLKD